MRSEEEEEKKKGRRMRLDDSRADRASFRSMISLRTKSILAVFVFCLGPSPLFAQDKPRVSPADTASANN